jgi:Na+/proline symporter
MDSNSLASWVTAGAAVVYTGGTFALWWTTRQSVEAMRAAFKLNFLLAYSDADGAGGMLRILGGMGDKTSMRESQQARALNRLLKKAFPKEYEELKSAMRGEAPPATPSK